MVLLNLDSNRTLIENGKLIINSYKYTDTGDYECIFIYETNAENYQIVSNDGTKYRFIKRKIKLLTENSTLTSTTVTNSTFNSTETLITTILSTYSDDFSNFTSNQSTTNEIEATKTNSIESTTTEPSKHKSKFFSFIKCQ
jgi:hypothetical protein